MQNSLFRAVLVAAALSAAPAAFAADGPAMTGKTAKGPTLTDAKGMTLYTFDKDKDGKSACSGQCAENWPPLMAASGAKVTGEYTLVKRDDGKSQWAYKGKPLYTWKKDSKPGDITGDEVNKVWHVAVP